MDVFWFLPTHGDGHYLGTTQGARPVTLNYLKQVAQAADSLGYYGVLIPTGRSCEDSWVIASALVPLTERLRYLVAIRPGIISPTVSARMAATLDRCTGRLARRTLGQGHRRTRLRAGLGWTLLVDVTRPLGDRRARRSCRGRSLVTVFNRSRLLALAAPTGRPALALACRRPLAVRLSAAIGVCH